MIFSASDANVVGDDVDEDYLQSVLELCQDKVRLLEDLQ